ncbi:DUF4367 domain-containing protein [Bacillus infantis]|uniref:DUF4367 domain-containing protein n=1 Tax=Bacillus infantis TaxID=324767 RepID=UPI003015C493
MEKELEEVKDQKHSGKLAEFRFTPDMKANVMRTIRQKETRTAQRHSRKKAGKWVPVMLTAVFLAASSAGVYSLVNQQEEDQQQTAEKKPELITPPYIPENYVFKHMHTVGELYEHIFTDSANEQNTFSYQMRKELSDDQQAGSDLMLADNLTGTYYHGEDGQSYIIWEAEGFYQVVEKQGDLKEEELFKIADSILEAKGYNSLLLENIEDTEKQEDTEAEAPDNQPDQNENNEPEENTEQDPGQNNPPPTEETEEEQEEQPEANEPEDHQQEEEPVEQGGLSRAEASGLSASSMTLFDQQLKKFDANLKHPTFKTEEEFYTEFSSIMTKQLAKKRFGYIVEEKADGLYLVATEGPIFLDTSQPYELKQTSPSEYKITQKHKSDLHGVLTIVITISKVENKWIMTDFEHQY